MDIVEKLQLEPHWLDRNIESAKAAMATPQQVIELRAEIERLRQIEKDWQAMRDERDAARTGYDNLLDENRGLVKLEAENERLRAENERMREALTPSGGTKSAYMGEFEFSLCDGDDGALSPQCLGQPSKKSWPRSAAAQPYPARRRMIVAEKPIIFSVPMVAAILDGRKTMTRRILKGVGELDRVFPVLGSKRTKVALLACLVAALLIACSVPIRAEPPLPRFHGAFTLHPIEAVFSFFGLTKGDVSKATLEVGNYVAVENSKQIGCLRRYKMPIVDAFAGGVDGYANVKLSDLRTNVQWFYPDYGHWLYGAEARCKIDIAHRSHGLSRFSAGILVIDDDLKRLAGFRLVGDLYGNWGYPSPLTGDIRFSGNLVGLLGRNNGVIDEPILPDHYPASYSSEDNKSASPSGHPVWLWFLCIAALIGAGWAICVKGVSTHMSGGSNLWALVFVCIGWSAGGLAVWILATRIVGLP